MIEEKEEIWKTIPEFPNYQVSNMGRVKSLNYNRTRKEKLLRFSKDKYGYLRVTISKEGVKKYVQVHRLVCEAFLQNPFNLPQVNHRNEDKTDNRIENLEYCDAKYNINYGTAIERRSKALINNPKRSKKILCVETGVVYPSTMEIERQFGFYHNQISGCCKGKYGYKTVGNYHWRYVD